MEHSVAWDIFCERGESAPIHSPIEAAQFFQRELAAVRRQPHGQFVEASVERDCRVVGSSGEGMENCRAAEVSALKGCKRSVAGRDPDSQARRRVFFSGPRYDAALRFEFPDMKILPLPRRRPASVAAVINADGLPPRTIRTYHPEYLQRSRQLHIIGEISRWALSEAAAGHLWAPAPRTANSKD
jgi:hypothetical protein